MLIYFFRYSVVCLLILLLCSKVFAFDQVHTAVSVDGSPFFTVVNSWTNGSSLNVNTSISNVFGAGFSNGWNHNFATYVYGGGGVGTSSTFLNNSNLSNYALVNNQNLLNFNFINVANWAGYNWIQASDNTYITNNGTISNTLDILNQPTGNFYNYSLYSVNSNNSYVTNNGNLLNIMNVSNSFSVDNLYNFSISSYDSKVYDSFQNNGIINNIVNITNSQINNGVFNYCFNSFSFTNQINVDYLNGGIINNTVNSVSSTATSLRNQGLLVFNPALGSNIVNITNAGTINSNVDLVNSNYNFLSNDGIAVLDANFVNINNNGNIYVNNKWDSNFTGIVDSTSGIWIGDVDQGSIVNNGLISIKGSVQNNFSAAGITLFNSGNINPIQISTPVLMDLDQNVRSIIVNQSRANLLSFGLYIDGNPNSYLRPILVTNSSNLNLNNTQLHLWIGNNIYLNIPYYIIENQGSVVNGQFDTNIVPHFVLANPYINVGWYDNVGNNSSIIFTINSNLANINNQTLKINRNLLIFSRNISEHIRDNIVLNNEYFRFGELKNRNWGFRTFNIYERFNSNRFGVESYVLGKAFIMDKYLGDKMKLGLNLSLGMMNINSMSGISFKDKTNYFSYGFHFLYSNPKSYILLLLNNYNYTHRYSSYTGILLDLEEKAKYNSIARNIKLEYGLINNMNMVFGVEKNYLSSMKFTTLVDNSLWQKDVRFRSVEFTEAYIAWDSSTFDKYDEKLDNNRTMYYSTIKFSYLLDSNKIELEEVLQGSNYNFSQEISRLTIRGGFFFYKPIGSRSLTLGLTAEFNRDYSKYSLNLGLRF